MIRGCKHDGCTNTPRYMNLLGEVRCSLHDMIDPNGSVRIW